MTKSTLSSTIKKWCIVLVFIVLGLFSLFWFFYEIIEFYLSLGREFFIFNRGAFYLLGAGVVFLVLMYEPIYKLIKKRELPNKWASLLTKVIVSNLFLIIALPILMSLLLPVYASKNNYYVCEDASYPYGWPIFKEIYYTKNDKSCQELTEVMKASLNTTKKVSKSSDMILP